jgi:RNA polymerase sigma-70 factor (ECF subfamily)
MTTAFATPEPTPAARPGRLRPDRTAGAGRGGGNLEGERTRAPSRRVADAELVAAALAGSETAFARLVAQHRPAIRRAAARMLDDEALAEDATQEALLKAWSRLASFRGEAAFGTWLYQIARNVCRSWSATARTGRSGVGPWTLGGWPAGDPAPDEQVARAELARYVRGAVARLPEEYRAAVWLHHLEGVPYAEVAAALGVPLGTVKSRISRGRLLLGRTLGPLCAPLRVDRRAPPL